MAEAVGGAAAQAALAYDEEELARVVDLPGAVTAGRDVIAERSQQLFLHFVVEEQEDHLADSFAIHRPSSAILLRRLPLESSARLALINSPLS
jgi:hypothetical protein